ncbi:MAG TPA: phage recombination protein Bet [Alphaproteobacteria bacterium]|nr:phage recombination protein Bet [Alphaproteobacteria bacterium]
MNTAVAEKTTDETTTSKGAPPVPFQPPRLPYHPAVEERFGIDKSGWNALVNAIYPSAKSVDSVCMVLSYCKSRQLDPFKRPVHIVPMWDARRRTEVETVWPGIAEIRTTASRTGEYAGCDEAAFGPDETQTFKGSRKVKGNWEDHEITVTFPQWCQITVYRLIGGHRCAFVGPKVHWLETYATTGKGDLPNDMWARRTRGQLEKCAEAAALRKAFPEELGNMLTAEEMHGQRFMGDEPAFDHEPVEGRQKREPVKVVQGGAKKSLPPVAGEPANIELTAEPEEGEPEPDSSTETVDPETGEVTEAGEGEAATIEDADAYIADLEGMLAGAMERGDRGAFDDIWDAHLAEQEKLFPPDRSRAVKIYQDYARRFSSDADEGC